MRSDPDATEEGAVIQSDSQAKWVVRIVSAALVGGLALLATSERTEVQNRLKQHDMAIQSSGQAQAVQQYRLDEQERRLERMESKLDLILERMPKKARE